MADTPSKPRRKRELTVRERSQTDAEAKPKQQRLRKSAAKPLTAAGQGVKRVAKPFKPLAKPFQVRPVRFTGRILAKVLLINYFISSWRELKLVTWPDRKETTKLTLAVFVFAIVFGFLIAITDYGLDKVFHKILLS